jgi:hypothetical protein
MAGENHVVARPLGFQTEPKPHHNRTAFGKGRASIPKHRLPRMVRVNRSTGRNLNVQDAYEMCIVGQIAKSG